MTNFHELPASARHLRALRAGKGVTQRGAAEAMGMNNATLCNLENGLKIGPEHAHALSQYYGVPVSEFWQPKEIPATTSTEN